MKSNESSIDRIIRAVVGVAALVGALAIGIGTIGGVVLLVLGGVLVVTAATGFCPLYRVLGLSTVPAKK
jgi:hypothetical protein